SSASPWRPRWPRAPARSPEVRLVRGPGDHPSGRAGPTARPGGPHAGRGWHHGVMQPELDARPGGEVLVSVDVETSGPSPSVGCLLSLGACLVDDPEESFYVEVRPAPGCGWDEAAAAVHLLDRARLEREGTPLADAMTGLAAWLERVAAG